MIGQKNNLEFIEKLSNDNTPHFIIIVGGKGSGKTTLARIIADKLNATFSICGTKVDNIREVIDTAYGVRDKVLYCIQISFLCFFHTRFLILDSLVLSFYNISLLLF